MARVWVLMMMAATLLLTGLAAMTEDRAPPTSAVAVPEPSSIVPTPPRGRTEEGPAGRRSTDRRPQRGASMASSIATGSVLLATAAGVPSATEQVAGPVVVAPVPIPLVPAPLVQDILTREPPPPPQPVHRVRPVTITVPTALPAPSKRPVPKRALRSDEVASVAGSETSRAVEVRAGRGHRPAAHRKHGPRYAAAVATNTRRQAIPRVFKPEAFWPRATGGGS